MSRLELDLCQCRSCKGYGKQPATERYFDPVNKRWFNLCPLCSPTFHEILKAYPERFMEIAKKDMGLN